METIRDRFKTRANGGLAFALAIAGLGLPQLGGGGFDERRIETGGVSRTVEEGCGLPIVLGDGPSSAESGLSSLPLAFVENRGQWEEPVRFLARRSGEIARLDEEGMWLEASRLVGEDRVQGVAVRLEFEGASPDVSLRGEDQQPGVHHFFLGNDPSTWRTEVPAYGAVLYRGLYDGVDVRVREDSGRLEYDVLLAPGADLSRVVIRCEGIEGLRVEPDGALEIDTALGPIRQKPPRSWLEFPSGGRRPVESRYRLVDTDRYGFEVSESDPGVALVIDPGLEWSTFFGGFGEDLIFRLVQDGSGIVTVAGQTTSPTGISTPGAYDTTYNGGGSPGDAFVARLDPNQIPSTQLLWSTYLGGSDGDRADEVALGPSGSVAVRGRTLSVNFPTTMGAFDTTYNGGGDAFVARLDSTGSMLLYSTFLGGTFDDGPSGFAVDGAGNISVAGWTASSTTFPTTSGAFQPVFGGGTYDVFFARLSPNGNGVVDLLYATFLGGSGDEPWARVALETSGAVILAGPTNSCNFPPAGTPFDPTCNGGGVTNDVFVARLDPSLVGIAQLVWSTYLGGTQGEQVNDIAVGAGGEITLGGWTWSPNFPTSMGAFDTTHNGGGCDPSLPGGMDAYIARVNSSGSTLLYGTFLGGSCDEGVNSLAVDSAGRVTVAGSVGSSNFPTTAGAYDSTFNGGGGVAYDAFVTRLDPSATGSGQLLYSTFLGGSAGYDYAYLALKLDATGAATVSGTTSSFNFPTTVGNFPTTAGAFDTTYNGNGDGFVTRLDLLPTGAGKYGASSPGCTGPLAIGVNSIPQIGNGTFAVTCTNGPNNGTGVLGVGLLPLATPIPILGVNVWVDPLAIVALLAASSNALGYAQVGIPIPNVPALAGGQVYAQFVWLGPNAPSPPCPATGFSASNTLQITVQ